MESLKEEKPLTADQVKFKADAEEQAALKGAPQIQELASTTFTNSNVKQVQAAKPAAPPKPVFDWKTAERVDAKFTFLNQGDLIFINLNFKGYNKDSDVRYAFSDNEMLLEVRDVGKNKVHRICKTLNHPIICQDSSAQLLVDFIVFKLKKASSKKTWDQLGYDIQDFQIPQNHLYMRSNFLKQQSAMVGDVEDKENQSSNEQPKEVKEEEATEDKGYHKEGQIEPKKAPEEMTEEEKQAHAKKLEDEAISRIIERSKTAKQMSFLSLKSDFFKV